MATQYVYVCDRCKKKVNCESLGRVKIQKRLCMRISFRTQEDEYWNRYPREYALCSSCRDEMEKFLRGSEK